MRFTRTLLAALLLAGAAFAHPPLPPGVLEPRTPAEAWNVLRLAVANTRQLLGEQRFTEVPDQISLCSPALRALTPASGSAVTVRAAIAVQSIAQASGAGDAALAQGSLRLLQTALDELGQAYPPAIREAEIAFCPMHPDVRSAQPGTLCSKCGMALVPRRIPYSFVYMPPGEPSLRLTASAAEPLQAGRAAQVTLRLTQRDGTPVPPADLLVVHTQPLHLLIIDPALGDYHHEHPAAAAPGVYSFTFTPRTAGPYRIFADVVPAASGVQEYPFADLPGPAAAAPPRQREPVLASEAGGLRFALTIDEIATQPLRAREARTLRLRITRAEGGPVRNLEPVMNAFAHLVGFYEDYRTVLHLHPVGSEVTEPTLRGGPELEFRFYPPKAGALRLYAQVQVDGRQVFAPFDLQIP